VVDHGGCADPEVPGEDSVVTGRPGDHTLPPALVDAFLEFACWDHHVHGRGDHRRADLTAQRLLAHHPELPGCSLATAIVCGALDEVRRRLDADTAAVTTPGGPQRWTPLLHLAFTRFSHPATLTNAVAIGRLLLERGADPDDFYMAGSAPYSALVGAAGEGEQDSPRQCWGPALFDLLLEHGAKPFDQQVLYNTHFHGDVLWWLELVWARTQGTPLADTWRDPEWRRLDMGGYGTGARFLLDLAERRKDSDLREWVLAHGGNPSTPSRWRVITGADTPRPWDDLFAAARQDDVETVRKVLDAGVPVDIADEQQQRALHVAAGAGAVRVARLLLDRGADVDRPESRFDAPPIGFAAHHHHVAIMDLLAPRSQALFVLCANGYVDRVRELLAAHPERARQSWKGETLLFWLPEDDDQATAILDLLLAHGANANVRRPDGRTAADAAERRALTKAAARLRRSAESG
jgi:hypothetical protein